MGSANRKVRIKARIRLLTSEEDGRTAPLLGIASYRPNHNFLDPGNRSMGMGSIELPSGVVLRPGESTEMEMTLHPWPEDTDLSSGREWRIQEGGQLVGIGTVLEVLTDNRDNSYRDTPEHPAGMQSAVGSIMLPAELRSLHVRHLLP